MFLLLLLTIQLGAPPLRSVALASPVNSRNVALVPSAAGDACCAGVMPTSGPVTGTGLSFNGFKFTNLAVATVSAATLAPFDTVVLLQVQTGEFTAQQQADINSFVDAGHKLIIYDADATQGENYSWLARPFVTAPPCPNCGLLGGTLTIVEQDTLGVGDPTSPYYINTAEIPPNTDAVGDANVISTNDPNWFGQIRATNARSQTGWTHAYATSLSGHGLIIYNGLDTDFIGDASWSKSGINWLAKLWYLELAQQWDPSGLPGSNPIASGPPPAPKTSWINGRVVLQGSEVPIPNAEVYLTDTPLKTMTNGDGDFQFAGLTLTAGYQGGPDYGVSVIPPAGYQVVGAARQTATIADGHGAFVVFRLARVSGFGRTTLSSLVDYTPADGLRTNTISVTLRDDKGAVLPNEPVTLVVPPGATVQGPNPAVTSGNGIASFVVGSTTPGTVTWQIKVGATTLPQKLTTYFTTKAVILLQGDLNDLLGSSGTWGTFNGSGVYAALGLLGYPHSTVTSSSCSDEAGYTALVDSGLVLDYSYAGGIACVKNGQVLWDPKDHRPINTSEPTGAQMGVWLTNLIHMMHDYDGSYYAAYGSHVSFYLIGHSMGGKVAFSLEGANVPQDLSEASQLLHKGEVASVVTVDSPLNYWPTSPTERADLAKINQSEEGLNSQIAQAAWINYRTRTATVTNTADYFVTTGMALISGASYSQGWDVDHKGQPFSVLPEHGSLLHPTYDSKGDVLTDGSFHLARVFAGKEDAETDDILSRAVR